MPSTKKKERPRQRMQPTRTDTNDADGEREPESRDHETGQGKSVTDDSSRRTPMDYQYYNRVFEEARVKMEDLFHSMENSPVHAEVATSIKSRKRRKSAKLSEICLMFERAHHSPDGPRSMIPGENQSNRTTLKRLRSTSLPASADEFIDSIKDRPSINEYTLESDLPSKDQFNKLIECFTSQQHTASGSSINSSTMGMPSCYNSELFYSTLKFFEEKARAATSANDKVLSGLTRCANTTNDAMPSESKTSQPLTYSVEQFNQLINAFLSRQVADGDSRSDSSVEEVIANYHNSMEFHDLLKFFEEKAKAGNQSAIDLISVMRKYACPSSLERSCQSLLTNGEDMISDLANNDYDSSGRETLRAPSHSSYSYRQSLPMDFAPTCGGDSMLTEVQDIDATKCEDVITTKQTDRTVRPILRPISTNSIHQMRYQGNASPMASKRNATFDKENAPPFADETKSLGLHPTIKPNGKPEKSCDPCTYFDENFRASVEARNASSTPKRSRMPVNSDELFKAAISVAEMQQIDINVNPSTLVSILALTETYMRSRMTSGRIPFESIGSIIAQFIAPYMRKPLARFLLEDLTAEDKELLIDGLGKAAKDFPNREIRRLAQGEITSGTLYLAVSRAVNDFASKICSKNRAR